MLVQIVSGLVLNIIWRKSTYANCISTLWHLLLDRERLLTLQSTQCIESPSSGQEVDAAYFLFLQSMQRADMIPDSFLPFDGVYVRTIDLRASPKVCHILFGKSCDLPTPKTICQVKKQFISNNLLFRTWQNEEKKDNRQHANWEKTLFSWSVRSMQAEKGFAKPPLPSCHICVVREGFCQVVIFCQVVC